MKVDGSCHCGAIAYEAEIDPATVSVCHCTDCQALTGSAFRVSVSAPPSAFRLLRGEPKTYVKTTAESGTKRIHAFCAECGAPVYATALTQPAPHALRVGALTQRAALAPRRQIWCRSAVPWSTNMEKVPQHERQA